MLCDRIKWHSHNFQEIKAIEDVTHLFLSHTNIFTSSFVKDKNLIAL